MAKTVEKILFDTFTLTVDGSTVSNDAEVGRVIRATPKTGGAEYVRLQFESGESYKWDGVSETYSKDVVADDPNAEVRWVKE